ncbi:MAG TPA: TonB-dependent receptor [Vicinamibacterales bacterium]|nr:TonB-dependent receptor [Vicinamibacterales bacterium]
MKRAPLALGLVAVAILAAGATVGTAQESTTGTIAGQVLDPQGLALPGATVTVTSPQGTRTFVTDAEGRFLAPFLAPGRHTVRVELAGFRPVTFEDINVQLGQRVTVPPITLGIAQVAEQVDVVGTPPTVDTTTSGLGANLDSEFLARLPVQRQMSDVVYLAPGVSTSGGAGRANPSISGASGLENQYVIDGVNVSNTGYGGVGSYSIVFGSLGTGVPFDFISEVQVKTGGYEAEFGQATGGVVQAVTKSGANSFFGAGFGYWQPEQFEGEYRDVVLPNATRAAEAVNTRETFFSDVGFTVGGPIVRDRVFFFGALDRSWERTGLIAPEGFPLRDIGIVERERRATSYSAKGTFQVSDAHRLDISAFGDPSHGEVGPQRRSALLGDELTSRFSEIDYGGHNQTVRYEGILTPSFLVTGSVSRSTNIVEELPSLNAHSILDTTTTPNLRFGGIGFFENNDGENVQYQAKATYLWRDHEFRVGALYEDIAYDNIVGRTGPTFTLPNGEQTRTGANVTVLPDPTFGRIYRVTRANLTNVRSTTQNYTSFFLQDTWRIHQTLTLKPGVRYEQQKLVGNLADQQWDGNWAPRLGAVWDPTGQGRLKVYGNWGRYYAKIPNDLAARALSADAAATRADYFDEALTQPVPEGLAAGGATTHLLLAGLHPADFDPDSKSTYSDEWLVGAQVEVVPTLSVGVSYQTRSFGRILEDIGQAPVAAYFLEPGSELASVEYFITNPGPGTPVSFPQYGASFEEAIHDYDAVTFTIDKRFSNRWGIQSSYRLAWLEGTFEGFFRNDNDQSDPAITSLFDFPTNDPSYTEIGVPELGFRGDIRFLGALGAGPLPLDRRHSIKVYGNYLFGMGLNLGVGMTALSGTPLTALASNPVYDNAGEIPETPRGAGFETVDGFRTRTPWDTSLDLHADYSIRLGGQRLMLLADVFNVFNRREPLAYDNYTEVSFAVTNPDFGRVMAYQSPRRVRVGARFEF